MHRNSQPFPDTAADRFERRILLAITGLTPQVVTETLYALHVQNPSDMPTEVHLLSTAEGVERARLTLLSEEPGWFHRFCRDYTLAVPHFDESCLHVLLDARDRPLQDIRTPEDNEWAANGITELIRRFTADASARLHVSIAGGRKTMGFYAGYALSLYGRPQDRLSHVLVKPPYEGHPEFYYPTPYARVIYTLGTDPKPLDTRGAEVTLAEIPFVRMRHSLPETLLMGRGSFFATVGAAQIALAPPSLTLDLRHRRIQAGSLQVSLPPAQLALLSVFARRAQNAEPPLPAPPKGAPDIAWADRYLQEVKAIMGEFADLDETERALAKGMDGDYFSAHLSKLRRHLKRQLGHRATPYLIDDGGKRPHRYRLALPPDAVRFAEREKL